MTEAIWRDIEIELERLEREEGFTQRLLQEMPEDPPSDSYVEWRDKKALADAVESLYTGMERVLNIVAEHCDGEAPAGRDWHRRLIDRLAHEGADSQRPPLLSSETAERLHDLRGFRHRSRQGYGAELDWRKTRRAGGDALDALTAFRNDLHVFGRALGLHDH
ncbi:MULTISPECIES: hypothetical protein [Halorhodospira]|uniref:ribonuclease toxin HepT-like protein n=1 Tax=Halorhodospira TaxID=85108 RepID=UPI001EE83F58|nr:MULTISPECIES: hypothetical protein [Halorhodospira]MCG5527519.1 hypothetical protein [Halorhodospira halophila]MCG5544345.1 hypothetical protein [Halorhodospira sp. 9628]